MPVETLPDGQTFVATVRMTHETCPNCGESGHIFKVVTNAYHELSKLFDQCGIDGDQDPHRIRNEDDVVVAVMYSGEHATIEVAEMPMADMLRMMADNMDEKSGHTPMHLNIPDGMDES